MNRQRIVIGGRLRIDLRQAEVIDTGHSTSLREAPSPGALDTRLSELIASARGTGREGLAAFLEAYAGSSEGSGAATGGDPFRAALLRRLQQAHTAQRDGDTARCAEELLGMVGLGAGLTPSGDDLLVGILASLSACSWIPEAAVLQGYLVYGITKGAADGTTDVGRAYLSHAAKGRFADRVTNYLDAVVTDKECRGADIALKRLLSFGAASGGETALGVLYGLSLIGESAAQPEYERTVWMKEN